MEFEINKNEFLKGLKILQSIPSSKLAKTNPVLENFLIEAKDNKLKLTASNTSIRGISRIDSGLKIKEEGKILVNAQKFIALVETFNGTINLKTAENQIVLSENKTKINLPSVSYEYPPNLLEPYKYDSEFKTNIGALKTALSKVIEFRKPDSYEAIGGISFKMVEDGAGKKLKLCATNSNALAVYSVACDNMPDVEFILPGNFSDTLLKNLSNDILKEEIQIKISKKRACFQFGSIELETTLINSVYPKYEMLIPKYVEASSEIKSLTVEKKALEDLFKKTLALKEFVVRKSDDGRRNVLFYNAVFECGMLTKVRFSDKLEDYIPSEFKGEPITIAFNPDYIGMVLRGLESNRVTFLMKDELGAALFTEGDYTALVMPVMVRG